LNKWCCSCSVVPVDKRSDDVNYQNAQSQGGGCQRSRSSINSWRFAFAHSSLFKSINYWTVFLSLGSRYENLTGGSGASCSETHQELPFTWTCATMSRPRVIARTRNERFFSICVLLWRYT
jgi:hypothetical protein